MTMKLLGPLFLFAGSVLASCASAPGQGPGTDKQRAAVVEEEDGAACDAGFARGAQDGRVCNVTYGDKCFESAAEACACAGCGDAGCLVLESYPAQARCEAERPSPSPDPDHPASSPSGEGSARPTAPSGSSIPPAPPGGGEIPPAPPGGGEIPPAPPNNPGQTPAQCAGGFPATNVASGTSCNWIHGGQCFEEVEDACACAGCDIEDCRVLESYPAQVACD
jgi:hypothetical protein